MFGSVSVIIGCVAAFLGAANGRVEGEQAVREQLRQPSQLEEREQGFRWGYSVFLLANEPHVQQELILSEAQRLKIEESACEYASAMRQLADRSNTGVGPAQSESPDAVRALSQKRTGLLAEHGKRVYELLTDTQRKRLDQIAFQLCGVDVLAYAEVSEALELSDAQEREVAAIRSWRALEWRKRLQERNVSEQNANQFQEELDDLLGQSRERVLAALNARQRDWFLSTEGPKIPFQRHDLQLALRVKGSAVQKP